MEMDSYIIDRLIQATQVGLISIVPTKDEMAGSGSLDA